MGAPAKRCALTEEEASILKLWAASRITQRRMAVRARVVLAATAGVSLQQISSRTGLSVNVYLKWRKRFSAERFKGLAEKVGRGRPQSISQEERLEFIPLACTTPTDGCRRWSMRKLADVLDILHRPSMEFSKPAT
jgi:transposase